MIYAYLRVITSFIWILKFSVLFYYSDGLRAGWPAGRPGRADRAEPTGPSQSGPARAKKSPHGPARTGQPVRARPAAGRAFHGGPAGLKKNTKF